MGEETHEAWMDVYREVARPPVDGRRAACPNCGFFNIACQFVAHRKTRSGFCALWCTRCGHGHALGRLEVPRGVEFLAADSSDAEIDAAIPPFTDVAALAGR